METPIIATVVELHAHSQLVSPVNSISQQVYPVGVPLGSSAGGQGASFAIQFKQSAILQKGREKPPAYGPPLPPE